MKRLRKFTAAILTLLISTSLTAFAEIPSSTVVIGDKAYDLKYANKEENLKEIIQVVSKNQSEIYIKVNGHWFDNSTGNVIKKDLIPSVLYKSHDGKTHEYADKDGEEITLKVDQIGFINSNQIQIQLSKKVQKESIKNKSNIKINNKELRSDDSIDIKEDGKTLIITLGEKVQEENSIFNISLSKNIQDSNENSMEEDYEKSILVLNKKGHSYKSDEAIHTDLNIIGNDISLENTEINGDLYILADNVKVDKCQSKGTIVINPGKEGTTYLSEVEAKRIDIHSGGEHSIHLYNVSAENLDISSSNKVRVESTGKTLIENTDVNSSTIIDSQSGSFGAIKVSLKETDKESPIELRGKFKDPVLIKTSAKIISNNAEIEKLKIETDNKEDKVQLSGNFKEVEINKEGYVNVENGTIEKLISNKKVELNLDNKSKVEELCTRENEVNITGEGKKNIDTIIEKQEAENNEKESSSSDSGSYIPTNPDKKNKAYSISTKLSFPSALTYDVTFEKKAGKKLTGYELLYDGKVIGKDTDNDGIVKVLTIFFGDDSDESKFELMKDGKNVKVKNFK